MRQYEAHEALWALCGKYLFCSGFGFTKQILRGAFWLFCLILPHMPHEWVDPWWRKGKNMRLMKTYEAGVFKGIFLLRIFGGVRGTQNMRQT